MAVFQKTTFVMFGHYYSYR